MAGVDTSHPCLRVGCFGAFWTIDRVAMMMGW